MLDMRICVQFKKYAGFISAELQKSSSNCQAKQRERERYKNKGDLKNGEGKLTFVTWKKSVSIFLKNKTSSHKVINFKRDFTESGFAYFPPCRKNWIE